MKICFCASRSSRGGKFGGFGRSTRVIGRELVKRGIEVSAIVPLRAGQRPVEYLDGIRVLGFPAHWPFAMAKLIRECDADIYHSQHPSFATWLARRTMPDRRHVVTFRDPKEFEDWWLELTNPSQSKPQVLLNWLYEDSPLVHRAIHRADGVYSAAPSVNEKIRRKYGFSADPGLLATAVDLNRTVVKADLPTVCFIGRLDRRKRPQLFFELAQKFPHVRFLAAGKSNDPAWEAELRERYGRVPNLELLGFVDQFQSARLREILGQSWILVNTSVREGLPTSFLEALANRCALLSSVDPGGVTQKFGYFVRDDDFAKGLAFLLDNDTWCMRGDAGWEYVRESFEIDSVIDRHLEVYRQFTAHSSRPGAQGHPQGI